MRTPTYRPFTSWREMESAEKFLAYSRWTLILTAAATSIVSALVSQNGFVALATTLSGALAVASLHREPQLRIDPGEHGKGLFRLGLLVHVGLIALSWVVLAFGVNDYVRHATLTVAILCLFNLMLAFTPFLRHGFLTNCAVATVGIVFAGVQELWTPFVIGYAGSFSAVLTPGALWTVRLMIDAHHARFLEAELQVNEERQRFSQDLHDTMGQHLAALSIKIQLAQKLASLDPARLDAELASLRQITDTAVDDLRHVVGANLAPSLASELAGAVSLLRGAGISVSVTGTPNDVALGAHEVAAWFIREATTNILRHSDATAVAIDLSREKVSASNDNPRGGTGVGTGIVGLRRRAAAIDAQIAIDHTPEAFTITLELP